MSNIVLIHGFATGIRFSIFRAPQGTDAGFEGFREDIARGTALPFRWDISDEASFFDVFNPRFTRQVFIKEHLRAQNSAWQERLVQFLEDEQPSTILCHSLGCVFMLETMNRFGIPPSVHTIVFNQSALPTSAELTNPTIQQRITARTLQCINTYCPWDPTLWIGMIIERAWLNGLFPTRKTWLTNIFFPLYLLPNLHTSAIRSQRFRDWVFSL